MPVRVKIEDTQESSSASLPPRATASLAEQATADLPPMDLDMDEVDRVVNDDEEDEIVREIDVYLSPELSRHLHLMQFPLQRQPSASESATSTARRDKPEAARIKPRHCMIELDYSTKPSGGDDEDDGKDNGLYYITTRTFSSQTIPLTTHMTLGKFVADGSAAPGLHLVPLTRITQMRPNFQHVNEATLNMSPSSDDDPESVPSSSLDGRRPLTFQKKETERAALARKSSYAFKKASEESEIWIPLEVHSEQSVESKRKLEKVACQAPNQNLLLGIPNNDNVISPLVDPANGIPSAPVSLSTQHASAALSAPTVSSSLAAYIQSLNYLPSTQSQSSGAVDVDMDSATPQDLASTVVTRMVQLMHLGWPIPYSVLRDRFDPALYSDDVLLQALSTCAVLVRGNFVLQSRLMPLPVAVAQARTFLLFLFQTVEVVHRPRLEHVYHGDTQVTSEVLLMLLEQVGTRTKEGWKLKVDDDLTMPDRYPDVVALHLEYWTKQVRRFGPLFDRYRQMPQVNGYS